MISNRMLKFTLPSFTYFGTPILIQPPFMRISIGADSLGPVWDRGHQQRVA